MWSEDPSKASMVDDKTVFIEPEEIAEAMYDLVVDEKLGNGTIYECSRGATRVVPEYNAPPPSGEGSSVAGYYDAQKELYARLKKDGMKV